MSKVVTDVDQLNSANWEGTFVALLGGFIVENGQLMQYLQGHGISQNVLMAIITLVLQRGWVYVRSGRQIADLKLQTKVAGMVEEAKTQARQVGIQPPAPPTYRQ